jgi:hypothetical protein
MVAGLKITPTTSNLYAEDGALSYYSTSNGVYLNGAGASGWLRLQASGVENDQNSINIYGSDGNYMNFRTANSTRMTINYLGNVGINTTGPCKKLEVVGCFKLGTNAYIEYGGVYPYTITTANTAAVGNLVFSAGLGSAAYESRIDLQGTNTAGVAGITLSTASTARMVVTADGDVGIGNTNPSYLLDVGAANIENPVDYIRLNPTNGNGGGTSNTFGGGLIWAPNYNTYTKKSAGIIAVGEGNFFRTGLAFFTNNSASATGNYSERMRIDMDGNVGIGTTTPLAKLDIQGTQGQLFSVTDDLSGSIFAVADISGVPIFDVNSSGVSYFDGKVGIVTASPAQKLHIKSTTSGPTGIIIENTNNAQSLDLYFWNNDVAVQGRIRYEEGAGSLALYTNTSATAAMYMNYSNSVIIGGTVVDQSGTFSIKSNGFIRGVLASGSNESSVINAIVGVSNGFQLMNNASNEQEYRFHSAHTGGPNISFKIEPSGTITAAGDVVAYSDKRLKSNIKTLDGSKVYDMRGVSFIKDNKKGSGVIAQEMQKIAPELVNDGSEYLGVAYGNLSGYLIEAIKELKAEIEELKLNKCNCNK